MKIPSIRVKCNCVKRRVVDIRVKDNFGFMAYCEKIADAVEDVNNLRQRGLYAYYVSEKANFPYAVEGYDSEVCPTKTYAVFTKPINFPTRPIRFRPIVEAKADEYYVLNNQYSTIGTKVHTVDLSKETNYLKLYK